MVALAKSLRDEKILSLEMIYNSTTPDAVQSKESHFSRQGEDSGSAFIITRNSAGNLMISFRIDKRFVVNTKRKYLYIKYFDEGYGKWFLEYQSTSRANHPLYKVCATPAVELNNSNKWLKFGFEVSDGIWEEQIGNSDFRITIEGEGLDRFLISEVTLQNMPSTSIPMDSSHLIGKPGNPNIACAYNYLSKANNEFDGNFPAIIKPEISIIIPVFNRIGYTLDCLSAVKCYTDCSYEVIVVDNASTDTTSQYLSKIQNIVYIKLNKNYGFAYACNLGAQRATAENILFLNNDTIVQPGWVQPMLNLLSRQGHAGVVGSKLLYPQSGRVQHAGVEPGPDFFPRHRFHNLPSEIHWVNETLYLDAVTGACLLTKKSVFDDVGGFDEAYLNGYEDIDYCYKVRASGVGIMYCHESCVYHYESMTDGRLDEGVNRNNQILFGSRWIENFTVDHAGNDVLDEQDLPVDIFAGDVSLSHSTGSIEGDDIVCIPNVDEPGHCLFGSKYQYKNSFDVEVVFNFSIKNLLEDVGPQVSLDVYDQSSDKILVHESFHKRDHNEEASTYWLHVKVTPGQLLEYRVYWHGNCQLSVHKITLKLPKQDGGFSDV